MKNLMIQQTLSNGTTKTWKLRSTQKPQTFGASRLADLISISPKSTGIEAIVEFKNNEWWLHDMRFQTPGQKASPSLCVGTETTFPMADGQLKLTSVERTENLMEKLENLKSTPAGKTYQLFITKQGGRVTDVKILKPGQRYGKIPSTPSEIWIFQNDGERKIQQRSLQIENLQSLAHLTSQDLVDGDNKTGAYVLLGATFLIACAAIFGPKNEIQMAATELPRVSQKIIVKTDIKMHKPKGTTPSPQQKTVAMPPAAAPKAEQNPGTGGRVANMLKSISGGRISQLIGKVSSQAAKSANVIVSNGVKAGTGSSGRALAALGSATKSGRDWGTESGGKDIQVSTAGKGGGRNANGMGGLVQGKTGSGGVGLIEEEGEITGGLDREVIAQYIKSQLGQILYCYERQLSANPDLFGKVAVKFTIGPAGGVEQQLIGDTTLKNATVEGCILNRVAAWKFPTPQGGTRVLVTYPFLFKSTN